MKRKETEKEAVLRRFMQEFFPFAEFRKAGIFKSEMKGDYEAQAERVCQLYGYKTVYEYGAQEVICHLTEVNPDPNKPFVTVVPSIYD